MECVKIIKVMLEGKWQNRNKCGMKGRYAVCWLLGDLGSYFTSLNFRFRVFKMQAIIYQVGS